MLCFTLSPHSLHFTLRTPQSPLHTLHTTFPTQHPTFFKLHTLHSTPFHMPQFLQCTGTVTGEKITRLFKRTCFTRVFCVTAFGFMGCILFEINHHPSVCIRDMLCEKPCPGFQVLQTYLKLGEIHFQNHVLLTLGSEDILFKLPETCDCPICVIDHCCSCSLSIDQFVWRPEVDQHFLH